MHTALEGVAHGHIPAHLVSKGQNGINTANRQQFATISLPNFVRVELDSPFFMSISFSFGGQYVRSPNGPPSGAASGRATPAGERKPLSIFGLEIPAPR